MVGTYFTTKIFYSVIYQNIIVTTVGIHPLTINYFYFYRRIPPPEIVNTAEGPEAGVGPALSSALNVMAFTHDLDLTNTTSSNYKTE